MSTELKQKDPWDKFEIVLRPLNGLLTAVAVGLLGYYTSNIVRQQETRDSNERVYTELMSSREQAESGLRKDMFQSIIQAFLSPQSGGLEGKMLNLEMLAYNFHESLNLKPLFAHLQRLVDSSSGKEKAEYVQRLNEVAQEITTRQLVLLQQAGPNFSRSVDFGQLKSNPGGIELEPGKLKLDSVEREFKLSVLAIDPEQRELTVEMGVTTAGEGMQLRNFRVGYYDFPMIDNTRLSHDQRVAVVINQFGEGSADLTLVYFPGSYASLKEKVSYDEVVEKLRRLSQQ